MCDLFSNINGISPCFTSSQKRSSLLREICEKPAPLSHDTMGGSPDDVSEEPVMEKRKNGWRMSCDVGEATEELENAL